MLEFIGYFWLFAVYGWLNGFVTLKLYHWNNQRRDKQFLKHVRIEYPDSVITLSSLETSDREALNKIKEQLDELPDHQ